MLKLILGMITLGVIFAASADDHDQNIQLPKDYRATFTNYLSLDRLQNPDQIIRLFGNEIAMQGPGADGKLRYGSILVGEVYKAKKDENGAVVLSSLNRRIKDGLALIAVMQREPGFGDEFPVGLKNGDWDFAAYKPDGSVAGSDLNACRTCHAPLETTNHLFSMQHLVGQSKVEL